MNDVYLLLTGALNVFDDFSKTGSDNYFITHDMKNPKFELLRANYPILDIAGSGNDFSKAINLMKWVHENVQHCGGGADTHIPKDSISIMNYAFGKGKMPGIFCYNIAIVFTECCLAAGLIARTIHCKPFSPYDLDTHVVSMVYIRELNKWVFLDANNNAYFSDANGLPLSPLEARQLLARDEITVRGTPTDSPDGYKQYMTKNLFYIKFWAINTFGTDLVENQKVYFLAPSGFDLNRREIGYCEYAIKINPTELKKEWEDYLAVIKKQQIVTVSEKQFLQIG